MTTISSGAKVNGNALETSVETKATNRPVEPFSMNVFVAPGVFLDVVVKLEHNSVGYKTGNFLPVMESEDTVLVGTTTPEQNKAEDQETNHHKYFQRRKPKFLRFHH